jgi:plasmid stabilization system protein ParE
VKLNIQFPAAQDIRAQYDWYLERNPQIAERLATLFEETVVSIVRQPLSFPLAEVEGNAADLRRARLKGFPLIVLYRVKENEVEIIAVPHTSRDHSFWKSRLQN